ncbi:hypothetical protein OBBRIDRAFT_792995 [Obba rivulosa]|uniref:RRM domain-containing protein n=1 Tax=Obba rivulosa TaxID=1052685 RepID=A0A8E2AWY3_9APHY|nr:hypothetical protein OBBRIDRAFT_792995 [Obba rivulosa]
MPRGHVYLGKLPGYVPVDEVYKCLSIFGPINEVKLLPEYGVVQFASEEDAKDVLTAFSGRQFLGTDVTVEIAKPLRRDSTSSSQLNSSPPTRIMKPPEHKRLKFSVVVDNISPKAFWQELKDFGRLAGGEVAYCTIDRTKRGRGYIDYMTQEDANHAVKELNGKDLLGNVVTVYAQASPTQCLIEGYLEHLLIFAKRPKELDPRVRRERIRSRSRSPARFSGYAHSRAPVACDGFVNAFGVSRYVDYPIRRGRMPRAYSPRREGWPKHSDPSVPDGQGARDHRRASSSDYDAYTALPFHPYPYTL